MADLILPNIVGQYQQGLAFGTQMRQNREQEDRRSRLSGLAEQAYGASGDDRRGLLQQAVGVDPEAGFALGQNLGSDEDRQTKELVIRARMFANAPPEAQPMMWQQLRPLLAQKFPQAQLPDQPDAAVLQAAKSVADAYGGMTPGGRVQSRFVNDDGEVIALMADGTMKRTGEFAAPNIKILEQEGRVPTGYVTSGGRPGAEVPLGGGRPRQAAPPPGAEAPGAVYDAQGYAPIPAGELPMAQAAIAANERGEEFDIPVPGYGPARTPTQAETAAQVEAAKQGVQLQYLPEQEAVKTRAAIEQAGGKITAEKQAEAAAALPQIVANADEAMSLIDQAIAHPGRATVTGVGGIIAPNRYPAGTKARDFAVMLEQIKGKAFLQAFASLKGSGAITEKEGEKATAAIARLDTAQTDEAFLEALRDVQGVIRTGRENAKRKAGEGQQRRPSDRATLRGVNPQTGEVLVLVNGQWIPE